MTTIVPDIFGCGVQWYGNVPASLNVNANVSPWAMSPESNIPVSEVTVCATTSWFVQQTVVPVGTDTSGGS